MTTRTQEALSWYVGQIVQVQARTWPGINQPGGVGRITGLNTDRTRVAVRYVLDSRHEKEIDVQYVSTYGDNNEARLRDRSMLLGRCRVCGSLRSDCGSCDLRQEQDAWRRAKQRKSRRNHQDSLWRIGQSNNDEDENHDDDDDDSTDEIFQSLKQMENQSRKIRKIWRKAQLYTQNDNDDEDAESDIDEARRLVKSQTPVSKIKKKSAISLLSTPEKDNSDSVGSPDLSLPPDDDDSEVIVANDNDGSSSSSDDSIIFQSLIRRRRHRPSYTIFASPAGKIQRANLPSPHPTLDDSPLQNPSPEKDQDADDEDQVFIQPEGNVDALPADVRDESSRVSYLELPEFCDRLVRRLEREDLPGARRQLVQLERRTATKLNPSGLGNELENVYDDWILRLVRRGVDQCQMALRKITTRFRHHKAQVPDHCRHEFRGTGLELRENRVDQVSQTVQDIMTRLRQLIRQVQGREADIDDDDEVGSTVVDDGWAEPSASSPLSEPTDSTEILFLPPRALGAWDPHMHANRRKPAATRRSRFLANRARNNRPTKKRIVVSQQSRETVEHEFPSSNKAKRTIHISTSNSDSLVVADNRGDDKDGVELFNDENSLSEGQALGSSDKSYKKRGRKACKNQAGNDSTEGTGKRRRRTARLPSPSTQHQPGNPVLTDFFAPSEDMVCGTAPNQEPVAKRMERFLRANDIGGNDCRDIESPTSSLVPADRRPRRRTRRQTTLYEKGHMTQNVESRETISPQTNRRHEREESSRDQGVSNNYGCSSVQLLVFRDLQASALCRSRSNHSPDTSRPENLCTLSDAKDISLRLTQEYGSPSGRLALAKLSSLCRSKGFCSLSDASEIFSNIWTCVKQRGPNVLQYYVSLRHRELKDIILLHVTLLDAISGLKGENSACIAQLMAPVVPAHYVQFLVLQMVDSIMSLLLPTAWGLSMRDPTSFLVLFDDLRRSLGAHCNLLESCSKCITDRLPSQAWRVALDKRKAFISSVEPLDWATFLETGKMSYELSESKLRYRGFKTNFPRSEADALWTLLGYAGLSNRQVDHSAPCTRRLISALFSKGSLFTDPTESSLPPSVSQIEACAGELQNINSLLKAKSVDGSTMKDSFLANLIKQSVILGADFVRHVEEARIELFPAFDKNSDDWKRVKLLRKEFPNGTTNSGNPIPSLELTDPQSLFVTTPCFLGQDEALPSSPILRKALELFVQWFRTIPAKRVRYMNYEKAKSSIVLHLKELANETVNDSLDAFEQAFSTYTPAQSGQGVYRRNIFLLEAAAYLEILHAVSLCSVNLPQGVRHVDGLGLSNKVWNTLADEDMRSALDHTACRPSSCRDLYLLCVCARSMCFVGLLCEGVWPDEQFSFSVTEARPTGDEFASRNFVLGSLIVCFELACTASSRSVEVICFVCQRIVVYLTMITKARTNRFPGSDAREQLFSETLLEKLDSVCKKCIQSLISSSYCGSEEDICFCLVLLLADFVSSMHLQYLTKGETQPNDGDEWDDLDDSLFASIDLPSSTDECTETSLDLILSKALVDSTPSMTYTVHADAKQAITSVQGRLLVARRVKWLARSLALRTAVACDGRVSRILSLFWKIALQLGDGEDGAKELRYFRDVSFSLAGESCQLWQSFSFGRKSPTVTITTLVLKALEQLLELSSVSKLPSREMAASMLQNRADPTAAVAREVVLYKDLQKGRLEPLRKKSGRAWFVSNIISQMEESSLCTLFDAFRGGVATRHHLELQMEPCMEYEMIHRLHVLLHVLRCSQNESDFETLSAAAIGVISRDALVVLQTLKPEVDCTVSYDDAKGRVVFKSYARLYSAIVLNVLLEGTFRKLISARLENHILNECLIPLLTKRSTATAVMGHSRSFASSILYGDTDARSSPSLGPWSSLDDVFVDAVRERCPQIAIWTLRQFFDGGKQGSEDLVNALAASIVDPLNATIVARGLFRCVGRTDQFDSVTESVFSEELQTLLDSVADEQYNSGEDSARGHEFIAHILENVVAQKLRWRHLNSVERLRRLHLLRAILGQIRIALFKLPGFRLTSSALASVGNSILLSMWYALSSLTVDRNAVEASLFCATELFGLSSRVLGETNFGWISDWCSEASNSGAPEHDEREYLRLVSLLCSTICEILEDQNESSVREFNGYRKSILDAGTGFWAPCRSVNSDMVHSIKSLEEILGYTQPTVSRQVNNVYANRKGTSDMDDFKVDENILSAARQFLNEIRRD